MVKSVDLGYWIRLFRNNLSMNGQVGGSRVLDNVFRNNLSITGQIGE